MGLLDDLKDYWSTRRAGPQIMLDASALSVLVDGHISPKEVDAACNLLGALPWFHEQEPAALRRDLQKALDRYQREGYRQAKEVSRFAQKLRNPDGREVLLGICAFIIYIDEKSVTPEERRWLDNLAKALGFSQARLEELLGDIHGYLEAYPEATSMPPQ
jgi:tellurite resistance protein